MSKEDNLDILGFDPMNLDIFKEESQILPEYYDEEPNYEAKIDEDDPHINFVWNLLYNHIFKGGSFIPKGYEYMYLYKWHSDDFESSFNIGWWVGTNDFQWSRDGEKCDIFKYTFGDMVELNRLRKKYSPMTNSEFDKLWAIIGCLSNIDNHNKDYNEKTTLS